MDIFILSLVVFLTFPLTVFSNPNSESYTLLNSTNLAKPGCDNRCGDLIVPYPFGVGNSSECYIDQKFRIYCNTSVNPPKASFTENDDFYIKIISDSIVRTSSIVARKCYSPNGTELDSRSIFTGPMASPYTISNVNKFTLIGCSDSAWLTALSMSRTVSIGCMVFCSSVEEVVADECTGNGCCQTAIPTDIRSYTTHIQSLQDSSDNESYLRSSNPCAHAFIGEEDVFNFNGVTDLNDSSFVERTEATVPIVLEWAIGNLSCSEAEATNGYACQSNSICVSSERKSGGYRCVCKEGYQGNPYLSPGCKDINECNRKKDFPCYGTCINTPGNYTCKCKEGYHGDGKIKNDCRPKPFNVLGLSIGLGIGFLAILAVVSVLYSMTKKRKIVKLREKFYEQNGGAFLEEKLKTHGGSDVGFMKVFRYEELKEATNNFAVDRIIGRGGNGIVYRGTLQDNRVVAIKKSQKLDEEQREQFINEMVILTQINHTNVVQLYGVCLETDVPLLAYEFVSNNTLHHHIHYGKSGVGRLSWDSRLRIAHEAAGAIAYLHSDARMSIVHRDVKSTNILLDDNYTAKIADFGASRLIPLGDSRVDTLVQGTLGYLDPEYFHTSELTHKSDVYSFGVVLAELLTGQQALNAKREKDMRTLAAYFQNSMKENMIVNILEQGLANEVSHEQLRAMCGLVDRCLNQLGAERPSMKDVTMELGTWRKGKQPYTVPLISINEACEGSSSSTT